MTDLNEELKKSLSGQLDHQLLLLDNAVTELEQYKDVVSLWPGRKRRILHHIAAKLDRWNASLKKLIRPLNLKAYKREKKRIIRAGNITFLHSRGFMARFKLQVLRTLNILRIVTVLGFFVGCFFLLIYLVVKGLGLLI